MSLEASAFPSYWRNARQRTLRVLDRLPSGDLEWSPSPGKFSFGDLFRHLAGVERFVYAECAAGRPIAYPGHHQGLATGLPALRAYLDRLHAESLEIMGALDPPDHSGTCLTPAGSPISLWKWFRAMGEHEAHHRGQLYLMLGLRNVAVPPLLGLTEEDLLALSRGRTSD